MNGGEAADLLLLLWYGIQDHGVISVAEMSFNYGSQLRLSISCDMS